MGEMWVYLSIFLLGLLLSSCVAQAPKAALTSAYRPTGETTKIPAYIEVIPWFVGVQSGSVVNIYVTVLDQNRRPLAGQEVRATIAEPAVARLNSSRRITDENGKAVFTLTGIAFPEITTLTFYAGSVSSTIIIDGFSSSMT